MITRRLATAIRKQDWSTLLIELVIVVAGIFLGLQANEWAQERENRVQEGAALERLFLESRNTLQLFEEYLQQTQYINQVRRNAVQFADSDDPVPENELPLKIGINTLARFPSVVPVSVAYDELRSAGQMQLIRSADIRDQIAGFYTDVTRYNQLLRGFDESSNGFWEIYQRHVTWDYNPESTTTDILLSTFNWESLRSDERFLFDIIGLLRNQLVAGQGMVELRDQARALCETLADAIGRTCD